MDRKRPGSGQGKTLAPIFTKKKAGPLMAHPNNSSDRNRGNSSHQSQSTSSQMRPAAAQNYQNNQQQQDHGRFQRSNSFSHNPPSQGAQGPQSHPTPDAWNQSSRYSQASYTSRGGPAPPGPGGDYFPPPAHPQFMTQYPYPSQDDPLSYQTPGGSGRNYYPQQPPQGPSYNPHMPPGLPQYDARMPYQPHGMGPYGAMGHGGGGEGSSYFGQQQCMPVSYAGRQPREAPPDMDDANTDHNTKDIGDAAVVNKEFEVKRKPQPDCSLHFITASIQGAKHWNKYVDKLPIMYEIFGVLNSAVTTGADGYSCSKEFLLKDDKDTMRCVFYQIDRTLPKMVRGHWYRCVGHLQKGRLNCVGVRETTDAEKKMYRTLIAASDRAMRNWVTNSKEA